MRPDRDGEQPPFAVFGDTVGYLPVAPTRAIWLPTRGQDRKDLPIRAARDDILEAFDEARLPFEARGRKRAAR